MKRKRIESPRYGKSAYVASALFRNLVEEKSCTVFTNNIDKFKAVFLKANGVEIDAEKESEDRYKITLKLKQWKRQQ